MRDSISSSTRTPSGTKPSSQLGDNRGRLVKKLLFPSYTDAGSNDTYTTTPSQLSMHTTDCSESLIGSEASTAVRDNRSTMVPKTRAPTTITATPTNGKESYHPVSPLPRPRVATNKTTSATITTTNTNTTTTSSSNTSSSATNNANATPTSTPSFFASTHPAAPTSPPKVPRMPFSDGNRSMSTTAVVCDQNFNESTNVQLNKGNLNDRQGHEESFQIFKVDPKHNTIPTVDDNNTNNNNNDEENNNVANDASSTLELFRDASGIVIMPRSPRTLQWVPATNECSSSTNTSSTSGDARGNDNKMQNRSILDSQSDSRGNGDEEGTTVSWEEEATPAQTAFGKSLLFQRILRNRSENNHDDILSIASEQGSVIDVQHEHSHFLTEVDLEDDEDNISLYTTPPQDAAKDEHNNINKTDDNNNSDNESKKQSKQMQSNFVSKREEGVDKYDSLEEKKVTANSQDTWTTAAEANHSGFGNRNTSNHNMLSMAIRRLGSGFVSSNTDQISNANFRHSVSAPTTPRPYHSYNNRSINNHSKTRSTNDGSNSNMSCTQFAPSMNLAEEVDSPYNKKTEQHKYQNQPQESAIPQLPSSFLLRSPGSVAYQSVSVIKEADRPKLEPRFSIWKQGTSNSNNSIDPRQIRLHEDVPEQNAEMDRIDEQPLIHQSSNMKAFQIARSCFSYDAVDTSMDEQYEFSVPKHQWAQKFRPDDNTALWKVPESASWDMTSSAFRPRHQARSHVVSSPSRRVMHVKGNRPNTDSSEFSPSSAVLTYNQVQQLKTPQRIEVEREDALDILACLVERGMSLKGDMLEVTAAKNDLVLQPEEFSSIVQELHDLSLAEGSLGDDTKNTQVHTRRKLALEELLRSHKYALEMHRVSQSASSWLKSIGRSQSVTISISAPPLNDDGSIEITASTTSMEASLLANVRKQPQLASAEESSPSTSNLGSSMDLLTAKALIHSAQMELKEKRELTDRLNEELAQCRAEIGRLKTASQVAVFRSPNRSILDESDDISVTEGEEVEDIDVLEKSFESAASVVMGDVDSSFLRAGDVSENETGAMPSDTELESKMLRAALDTANSVIRKLHGDLKSLTQAIEAESEIDDPPIVKVPLLEKKITKFTALKHQESQDENRGMVNDENFVSGWDDLSPFLSGPPDHELRSPIVASILEAWTSDHHLHESLLAWLDHILSGGDPSAIPPLTLSHLDHQVRDGFTLHVLPLLFRRPDIRVAVKSRVHRSTAYDLSVSVDLIPSREPISRPISSIVSDVLINEGSSTGSLNVKKNGIGIDAKVIRAPTPMRVSYDEVTEDLTSPDDNQPGFMSTLGEALGGLLSRRKGLNQETIPYEGPPSSMETILKSPSSAAHLVSDSVGLIEADQPYHRVVSAPPGRIGVTFVEYRGHCMVSDVSPDSPLMGWVYPSDVLIAIDELPVSGMRVRDIIKVLKDRTERQRALRVVSGHAMNEFVTLNASSVVDEAG